MMKKRPEEPSELKPEPPTEWLAELGRRFPGTEPGMARLVLQLLNVSRSISTRFEQSFQDIGLTEARFSTVMMIYRKEWEKGHATPSELAEEAGVGRGAMTQLLDALEHAKWVERGVDPNDGRRFTIKLTRKGRETLDRFLPGHYTRIQELTGSLSVTERKQLGELLTKLDSLQGFNGP